MRHQQSNSKGFNSALVQRDGLYFMTMESVNIPVNMQLEVHQTTQGTTAKITPVTLTPTGMEVLRNRNDLWTFNNQGYLVRVHRTQHKALFVPDQRCPVPTARLENYRRTIVRRNNGNNENIEDAYHTKHLTPSNKRESLKENLGQEKQGSRPREKHLYLAMHHQCQHYQQPGRQSNRRDEIHSKAATV